MKVFDEKGCIDMHCYRCPFLGGHILWPKKAMDKDLGPIRQKCLR